MDERRERDKDDPEPLLADEEDQAQAIGGHGVFLRNEETPRRTTSLAFKRAPIHVRLSTRRIRINPKEKRVAYINRLELLWDQIDIIISNTDQDEKTRIKAMNTLIRCIQIVYGIVETVEIEQIEEEINEIKKRQAKEGYLGYKLPPE
jgi:hypothetical protein